MSIKEEQDRLPTLFWVPKLHKRHFIANSSSCTTKVLSKLLTSCLTAVKDIGLDTSVLFTKMTELTIFGQLKIPMKFSINLNLKNFKAYKLSTYGFSTLYTTLSHHLIKDKLIDLINRKFSREISNIWLATKNVLFFHF